MSCGGYRVYCQGYRVSSWIAPPRENKNAWGINKIAYVITYPILFWDKSTEDFLNFLNWKINEDDIDYILKIYSEDVYENL